MLQVISRSPSELVTAFQAILDRATRICQATFGNLFVRDGDVVRADAVTGQSEYVALWRRNPMINVAENPGIPIDRVIRTNQLYTSLICAPTRAILAVTLASSPWLKPPAHARSCPCQWLRTAM